ncbi:50S ribosomal protein L18e [Candidatus Nanohalovita haloferacivicina]|uniref:50S ribosomal protein L18e n=1 Tax=Candidatus Nanohalovita haloferacivicina TaxID=2978046 RepID=UPI00325FAB22|nr:Ribosomal protein L18E [Candidatus Nanohalobia archaeon BNXNv]
MDKHADPTNSVLLETIEMLEEQEAAIWNQVAENLGKVNRRRAEVNISDIDRVAEDGDTIVVPGKVLGTGRLTKDVDVAAFQASNGAKKKIMENGDFMFIQDLVEDNPEGTEVRIVK